MAHSESPTARRIRTEVRRFRRESRAVSIPVADRLRYWHHYIGLARHGEQVYSPQHDAVYRDCRSKRGYDRACERINRRLANHASAAPIAVPAFGPDELRIEDYHRLMKSQVPFLVRDGARGLPMRERWTLDYLEQHVGDAEVPINEAGDTPDPDRSRPTKASRYYRFRRGTLGEVVAGIRRGEQIRLTTAEDVMHHDGARLRADLDLPWFEKISGWEQNQRRAVRGRLFVGKVVGAQLLVQPENAFTLWHTEPGDNFFVLARGHKRWTLMDPYYTAALRPRVKSTTNYHGSNIDIREPEAVLRDRGFAGYLGAPKVQIDVRPGDILRVPNHWWHTVETQPGGETIAVSIRAIGAPNLTCPGYAYLRLRDEQYHSLARAFQQEGRIRDRVIGHPRASRSERSGSA